MVEEVWLEDQRIQKQWEEALRKRPVCSRCGEPILTEYALKMENMWYCEACVRSQMREVEVG